MFCGRHQALLCLRSVVSLLIGAFLHNPDKMDASVGVIFPLPDILVLYVAWSSEPVWKYKRWLTALHF